ncbi:hypothetical protein A1O7_05859 [Cladophialophora yegresii CBS 114405]|uniref:Heterokaryon incompatibility domain-containing protein n=1 Tax=Cladophialophora yegresii CBS 114405 TaxID=1182544 RepID=W9WIW0_9EURO|nr:uncharacterized protein A1O7_05859 [Cladophialophora yegresii CBS 114405]EXJ58434.1 hypothetical protein A1O7_05859 [Cladophialophora yegresii CBS 114405]
MSVLYEPLLPRHTRVTRVRRGDSGELLITILPCRLIANTEDGSWSDGRASINGVKANYLALSYTWGNVRDKVRLQVFDTQHQEHELEVTRSLLQAIRQTLFDNGDDEFYLWSDQLSIDQSSAEEKTAQIMMMREIYEHAGHVVVWLGPASDDSLLGFRKIQEVAALFEHIQQPDNEHVDLHAMHFRLLDSFAEAAWADTPESQREWTAVRKVLTRPWFSRTWIRQEATAIPSHSTQVLCGPSHVSLRKLYQFLHVAMLRLASPMPQTLQFTSDMFSNLGQLDSFYHLRTQPQTETPLLTLVRQFRGSECTDLRDKIFCLVAFASDASEPGLEFEIDYSTDASFVYVNFAIWALRRYKSLDIFSDCDGMKAQNISLLSWTPNWTRPACFSPIDGNAGDKGRLYSASGIYANSLVVGTHDPARPPGLLWLSGIRIATICSVSDEAPLNPDVRALRSWLFPTDRHMTCPLNNIPMERVFATTISAGRQRPVDLWADIEPSDVDLVQVKTATRHRRLFFTQPASEGSRGLMGLGPLLLQPGDSLWMLKGGRALYALQESPMPETRRMNCLDLTGGSATVATVHEGDTVCQLMGECYVHGLMAGEILDFIGDSPKKTRPSVLEGMDRDFQDIYLV